MAKSKEYAEKKSYDYEFLTELATAAFGGGNSTEGAVGLDDGEGVDEMTDDQEAAMRLMLGDDYKK